MKRYYFLSTLVLGWLFILYEYAIRVSDSVIIDRLMQTLAVGPAQIGILSSAYFIPYVLMQIPAGLLIDRLGIRRCWPAALVTIALGCYIFSHSDSTLMASIGRALMGFGSAFAWVGAIKVIGRFSNGTNDAFYIGVSMTLCMLGAVLGQAPWLYLTNLLNSWQEPFLVASFVGVILGMLIYIFGHDYKKEDPAALPKVKEILQSCLPLFRSKAFWLLVIYMTAISAPQNAFTALWANEFLKHDYHLPGQLSATILSAIWFGGLLGAPVIGWISDRISNQKWFLIGVGIITLILMLILVYVRPQSIWLITGLLFLIGFITNASVIVYALAAQMATNMFTSSIIGMANMVNMGGAALIQVIIGWILSATITGNDIGNFPIALGIIPVFIAVSTISLLLLKKQCATS